MMGMVLDEPRRLLGTHRYDTGRDILLSSELFEVQGCSLKGLLSCSKPPDDEEFESGSLLLLFYSSIDDSIACCVRIRQTIEMDTP